MAIYFEKEPGGEVLLIHGSEKDIARFADDLKEALELRKVRKNPGATLDVKDVHSRTFEGIRVVVAGEEQMASSKRSEKRRMIGVVCFWLAIVALVLLAAYKK